MNEEKLDIEQLLAAFEPPLSPDTLLRMEVNLHLPGNTEDAVLFVALRVGQERMYVVRSLPAFLRALSRGDAQHFGKGFVLDPKSTRFERIDTHILQLLSEIETAQRPCEAQGYTLPQNGKFMPLGEQAALRLLRLLMARPFRYVSGKEIIDCDPIASGEIPLSVHVSEGGNGLSLNIRCEGEVVPIVPSYEFVYCDGTFLRLPEAQRGVARLLLPRFRNGEVLCTFSRQDIPRVISEVLPQMERAAEVSLSESLAGRVRREALSTRVYVDRAGERVIVRVAFQYGDTVIDPFRREAHGDPDGVLLVRDTSGEHAVLETLSQAGFRVSDGQIHLDSARRVLRFMQEGVSQLQKVADVYVSDAFKRMRPRRPQLSGSLRMAGGALELSLYDGDTPIEEIAELLRALREKKKFFRLPGGAFLELSGLSEWEELSALLGDAPETDAEAMRQREARDGLLLRPYRTAYLVSLLQQSKLPVTVDNETQEAARLLTTGEHAPPESLSGVLRGYQVRGFQWITALYSLRMGGILADDMGLGKTLQVIAAIVWAKEKEGAAPSLVVAPTSLVYNWLAEVQRFAPGLSATVIEGNQQQRQQRWKQLAEGADTDIIITSYPLLRRDSEEIGEMPFRFVVLDEAQHIKNPQSLAAVAAGKLNGRTRIALTGTPMENNPGELWSIFHFALPGYLSTMQQFMRAHGDGGNLELLRRRIRPFLMRRLKADVLPELPDKIESRVLADMPLSQRNLYAAAAMRLRERVESVLYTKGLGRGRMEVLSAITQLRQICCHPSLVVEDYAGSSGKLDALMELLGGALSSGRRVLLFSQFTSMLEILRRTLHAENVKTMYLDGKTPVIKRLEYVSRFNEGEGQVFLISLKAGGAGLNLTGADMVIHYDPWWNPAAEDQATDRAHRIGQHRVVQVIRLITRGTIEEQVARLSERKRALFDAVVTAGETMPQDLTEKEIVSLFSEAPL